jgi:hypothetical protein
VGAALRKLTEFNIRAAIKIRALPALSSWDEADQGFSELRRHFSDNTNRMHVLLKASAIDKLYSTRAGNIYWIADAVVAAMSDLGDSPGRQYADVVEIVDSISRHKAAKHPGSDRCASFASKYCHFFLDERVFPIYDSFALAAIKSLIGRVSRGLTPSRSEYRDFCERLDLLRVRDGLESVGVRDMDRFLWLWGLWLAQRGREKRVINEEVYDVFVSKNTDVQLLVRSLEPAVVKSP